MTPKISKIGKVLRVMIMWNQKKTHEACNLLCING